MSKRVRESWIGEFVHGRLKPLLGHDGRDRDAATLARLRRCAGKHPTSALEQVGGLFRDVPSERRFSACFYCTLDCAAIVAALFSSWHQGKSEYIADAPPSFGASFKAMADDERRRSGLKPDDPVPNVERRFAVLLDSHPDDLPKRLRQAVSMLRSKDIAINWVQLLNDLLYWNTENRNVQRRWARHFWAPRGAGETPATDSKVDAVVTG